MTIPKFKSQQDEILWDCLFDVNLAKYHDCFDRVRKQFYNHVPNESGVDTLREITDSIVWQTTQTFKSQKPEYDVHN